MNPALVQIAFNIISNLTGFDLHGTSPSRTLEFVRRRAESLNFPSAAMYLDELKNAAPSDPEPQRLINLITNGQTCFWRDEPQLEAYRAALREVQQRGLKRPIRVWCAGCSTGDEAYTAAMIADEEGVEVQVLGTDINTEVLAHAALGRYDSWSLRRLDPARREAYFEQVAEGQWDISERLFQVVEFEQHNILKRAPDFPELWDVIMCRNVLIYFSSTARRLASENFAVGLDGDGYLILGSSEQLEDDWHLWRASRQADGFVYRHAQKDAGTTMPIVLPDFDDDFDTAFDDVPSTVEEDTVDFFDLDAIQELLERAQTHRKRNELDMALACYEAAAGYDPFVPETYVLTGSLLEEQIAPIRAMEAYRKALFLEPFYWFAAFRLAKLHEQNNERGRAIQAYNQALEGLNHGKVLASGETFEDIEFPAEMSQRSRVKEGCLKALDHLES